MFGEQPLSSLLFLTRAWLKIGLANLASTTCAPSFGCTSEAHPQKEYRRREWPLLFKQRRTGRSKAKCQPARRCRPRHAALSTPENRVIGGVRLMFNVWILQTLFAPSDDAAEPKIRTISLSRAFLGSSFATPFPVPRRSDCFERSSRKRVCIRRGPQGMISGCVRRRRATSNLCGPRSARRESRCRSR